MTATEKAQIIKDAVDRLGEMLPLQWHDVQGHLINISQTGIGQLESGYFRQCTNGGTEPVWFRLTVDGAYLNGDGWYGYSNPPLAVHDGTYTDVVDETTGETIRKPNYRVDPLAAFFDFIEQAVS